MKVKIKNNFDIKIAPQADRWIDVEIPTSDLIAELERRGAKEEPLAVLANDKRLRVCVRMRMTGTWAMELKHRFANGVVWAVCTKTYAEAEQAARAYLEGLDDVEGGQINGKNV
jgi:hypothetical protein